MAQTKKVLSDGIIVTIGSILAFIFSYAFRITLARSFSVEEYGLFYSIWTFLTFFLFFLYLGLDQASIFYIVRYKVLGELNKIKTVISSTILFQLITTVIFITLIFTFSDFLEINYFQFENAGNFLKIMSLFLFFNVLSGVNSYILYGFQRMKIYAFYIPVQQLIYLVITIILIKFDFGLYSPFLAYLIGTIAHFLIFFPVSKRNFSLFKHKGINFKPITKKLLYYGLPVIFISIGSRLILQTDTLVLTKLVPMAEVGLYQAALPLASVFTFLSAGILTVLFPLFTELWHEKKIEQIKIYLKGIYKYLYLLLLPIITLGIFFSEEILRIMFGSEYGSAKLVLVILLFSVMFNLFSSINFQSISAFGKPGLVSKMVLFVATFNFIFNIVLIPILGIKGAAISTSISYLLLFFLSVFYLRRFVRQEFKVKDYLLPLFFCALLGFLFFNIILNELLVIFSIILFLSFYVLLIFQSDLVNLKEIKNLFKLLVKKSK